MGNSVKIRPRRCAQVHYQLGAVTSRQPTNCASNPCRKGWPHCNGWGRHYMFSNTQQVRALNAERSHIMRHLEDFRRTGSQLYADQMAVINRVARGLILEATKEGNGGNLLQDRPPRLGQHDGHRPCRRTSGRRHGIHRPLRLVAWDHPDLSACRLDCPDCFSALNLPTRGTQYHILPFVTRRW